jgi:hypothetical protein
MRALAAIVVVVALLAGPAAALPLPLPPQSAGVSESTSTAGARHVALTFVLRYQMQCGDPGTGPIAITLPAAMTAPAKIARTAVLVDGKAPASVRRRGAKIVVGLVGRKGLITCDVIAVGTLKLVLTRAAGIANPKAKGIYAVGVLIGASIKAQPKIRIT